MIEWGVVWDAYEEEPGKVWTEGRNDRFRTREEVEWEIKCLPRQRGRVVCRTVTPWSEPA